MARAEQDFELLQALQDASNTMEFDIDVLGAFIGGSYIPDEMTTLYDVMILVKKLNNPDSELEIFQIPMPNDQI